MPTAKTPASRAGLRSSTTPPVSRVMPGWRSRTSDAPPISSGTSCSNTRAGVDSSSTAPAAPPTAVTRARRRSRPAWPASSAREKLAALMVYMTRATVLVTFAVSAGSPTASRAGYDTSDASPATDPATPATTPATARRTMSAPCTGRILRCRRLHSGGAVGADAVAAGFLGRVQGPVGPGDHVGPADHGLPGRGRLLEEPVPGLTAVAVVVLLEVIEVEQATHTGWPDRAARASSHGSSSSQARRFGTPVRPSVLASRRTSRFRAPTWASSHSMAPNSTLRATPTTSATGGGTLRSVRTGLPGNGPKRRTKVRPPKVNCSCSASWPRGPGGRRAGDDRLLPRLGHQGRGDRADHDHGGGGAADHVGPAVQAPALGRPPAETGHDMEPVSTGSGTGSSAAVPYAVLAARRWCLTLETRSAGSNGLVTQSSAPAVKAMARSASSDLAVSMITGTGLSGRWSRKRAQTS